MTTRYPLGRRCGRDLLTLCVGVALSFAVGRWLGGDGLACALAGVALIVMSVRSVGDYR